MSLSDDSYEYINYCIEFYEEDDGVDGPPLIKKRSRLIAATVQNKVEIVKELLDSDKWYNIKDKYGSNLLQISILRESKTVFDYLLSLDDFPLELEDHDGKTALVTALCGFVSNDIWMEDYYAKQLIKRGADVNRMGYEDSPLTHWAIEREFIEVVRLLIEHGVDMDKQNGKGQTALHMCLEHMDSPEEVVTMLLCNGADATVLDSNNSTAFDKAVLTNCDTLVQENLFYYTFDQNMRYTFSAGVLLKLAEFESPLFDQVIGIVGGVTFDHHLDNSCLILFMMKTKYLQVLINKFDFVIKEILTNYATNLTLFNEYKRISVENFDLLLESKLKPEVLNFILEIDKNGFMEKLVKYGVSETHVTELVCFLLSYGMTIHEIDFQTIYRKFGYCDLFKILLYMDVEKPLVETCLEDLMPRLICDVRTDIQDFINNPLLCSVSELQQLLHYCAHPKLMEFCRDLIKTLDDTLKNMPQVPLLVELARNVFRRYFIQKFYISNTKQFYSLLKLLPIGLNHQKILSFETNLY